jgi:sugar/nucleoside kinase (ribokinase family)
MSPFSGPMKTGDEILEVARNKGVNIEYVDRARTGLPTGTVLATVDVLGNASTLK